MEAQTSTNRRIAATFVAGLAALALVVVAGCGGGDDETSTTAATGPDVDRYCELITELDQNSKEIYEQLGAEGVPSKADLIEAQRQVLDENADLIDELIAVVPADIQNDFQTSIDSARERAEAGDPSQPSRDVAQANLRLQKYVGENCAAPLSTDSSDQAG